MHKKATITWRQCQQWPVFCATMGGVGLSPIMPGTVGTLVGMGVWYLTTLSSLAPWWQIALALLFFGLGMLTSGRTEKLTGLHDPGAVVIDETAATFLTFLMVPFTWRLALLGLILNRVLDICKPFPIGTLQKLPGAWGIMLDDTAVGLLSRGILWVACYYCPQLS